MSLDNAFARSVVFPEALMIPVICRSGRMLFSAAVVVISRTSAIHFFVIVSGTFFLNRSRMADQFDAVSVGYAAFFLPCDMLSVTFSIRFWISGPFPEIRDSAMSEIKSPFVFSAVVYFLSELSVWEKIAYLTISSVIWIADLLFELRLKILLMWFFFM